MKRFLSLLAFIAASAHAATLAPVQLLNPVGSTSGQVIKSTGPSTAPAWGNVGATTLTGIVPVANGGTGWATLAAHQVLLGAGTSQIAGAAPGASGTILASTGAAADPTFQTASALGLASLTGATFTGASGLSYSNSAFTINDSGGAAKAQVVFSNAGSIAWTWDNVSASSNKFALDRYVGGSYVDSPISVANATGIVTMLDGIANSPISGSTGSFTTLGASGLITPTYPAGIKGNVSGSAVSAGSVGEPLQQSATGVAQTNATLTNITSLTLTAGDWDVSCSYAVALTGATLNGLNFGLTTTSGAQAPVNQRVLMAGLSSTSGWEVACPTVRFTVSGSTTVFLTSATTFTSGTVTGGGTIVARRR